MPRNDIVRIRGLRKRYGKTEALSGLDLSIPAGSVVLLVGPNGAGKTTLLKAMMDLVPFEEGTVSVFGLSPETAGARIRAGVGFVPERLEFPLDRMRVREILDFQSRFRPSWDPEYARDLTDRLDVRMDARWRTLSKGESRRVQLVAALAHRPPLLLLDEPVDGLDPVVRQQVLGLLATHLADTGATAIYSTHVLADAQRLADRLVVLRNGRARLEGDAETVRSEHRRIRFSSPAPPSDPPAFFVHEDRVSDEVWDWVVRASDAEVERWATEAGVTLLDSGVIALEDIALAHLGAVEPSHSLTPSNSDSEMSRHA